MGHSIRSKKKKYFRSIKRQRLNNWCLKKIEEKHQLLLATAASAPLEVYMKPVDKNDESKTIIKKPRRRVTVTMDIDTEGGGGLGASDITVAKRKRREKMTEKIGAKAVRRRREKLKSNAAPKKKEDKGKDTVSMEIN